MYKAQRCVGPFLLILRGFSRNDASLQYGQLSVRTQRIAGNGGQLRSELGLSNRDR
jgi:hypothetical protein